MGDGPLPEYTSTAEKVPPPPRPVKGAVSVHVVLVPSKEQAPQVTTARGWPCTFVPAPVSVTVWLVGPKLIMVANALGDIAAIDKPRTAGMALHLIVSNDAPLERTAKRIARKSICVWLPPNKVYGKPPLFPTLPVLTLTVLTPAF